jgi:hypothetical protein
MISANRLMSQESRVDCVFTQQFSNVAVRWEWVCRAWVWTGTGVQVAWVWRRLVLPGVSWVHGDLGSCEERFGEHQELLAVPKTNVHFHKFQVSLLRLWCRFINLSFNSSATVWSWLAFSCIYNINLKNMAHPKSLLLPMFTLYFWCKHAKVHRNSQWPSETKRRSLKSIKKLSPLLMQLRSCFITVSSSHRFGRWIEYDLKSHLNLLRHCNLLLPPFHPWPLFLPLLSSTPSPLLG